MHRTPRSPAPNFPPRYDELDTSTDPWTVLQGLPTAPPVSQSLTEQAFAFAKEFGLPKRAEGLRLYDPFCGSGGILTRLSTVHRRDFSHVFGSDVSADAVETTYENLRYCGANANIPVLSEACGERMTQLSRLHRERFLRLMQKLECHDTLPATCFEHNALEPVQPSVIPHESIDLIVTDPPHGNQVNFEGAGGHRLLGGYLRSLKSLRPSLSPNAVIVMMMSDTYAAVGSFLADVLGAEYRVVKSTGFQGHFVGAQRRTAHVLKAA